ncbi:MAG TPA: PIG-L family deacetylase, partial [Gemmatimonadales bacterium]|nr:PIG-L family deacetylase [Gemmatimonadales bacterium]
MLGALMAFPQATVAQLAPPANGGAPRLDALLHRLSTPYRVLVVAAHPDDEDTGLLAQLSRGGGVGVAYLSLSRGEGGQNLIGLELGTDLGLLRTQELLAARAIDGGAQFFTRAYDFGFTRDLTETERAWPPDSILKDVVRAVRRFRPHVLVSVFSGTPRDGHGQHQMAGVMASRAWRAAADPAAYPELAREEGLRPWLPFKLYRSARFDRGAATLALADPGLDPATGRTYAQIAMESRSQHRSQDFGVLQRLAPADSRLALLARRDSGAPDTGLFAGIPVGRSWVAALADSLRGVLVPARLGDLAPTLARAVTRARRDGAVDPEEAALLEEALAVAAGVVIDARADRERVVPGDSVGFELEVYRSGGTPVEVERAVVITGAGGWTDTVPLTLQPPDRSAAQPLTTANAVVPVPRSATPSQPYFLRRPLRGAVYDWSEAAADARGLPADRPPFTAEIGLRIDGAPLILRREVTARYQDQAIGEVRRPVRVVPRLEVTVEPGTIVWPAEGPDSQAITVTLRRHGVRPVSGLVTLSADGWPSSPPQPFRLSHAGETLTLRFIVRRPPGVTRADVTLRASA